MSLTWPVDEFVVVSIDRWPLHTVDCQDWF